MAYLPKRFSKLLILNNSLSHRINQNDFIILSFPGKEVNKQMKFNNVFILFYRNCIVAISPFLSYNILACHFIKKFFRKVPKKHGFTVERSNPWHRYRFHYGQDCYFRCQTPDSFFRVSETFCNAKISLNSSPSPYLFAISKKLLLFIFF